MMSNSTEFNGSFDKDTVQQAVLMNHFAFTNMIMHRTTADQSGHGYSSTKNKCMCRLPESDHHVDSWLVFNKIFSCIIVNAIWYYEDKLRFMASVIASHNKLHRTTHGNGHSFSNRAFNVYCWTNQLCLKWYIILSDFITISCFKQPLIQRTSLPTRYI